MTPRTAPPSKPLANVLLVPILIVVLVGAACSSAPAELATEEPSATTLAPEADAATTTAAPTTVPIVDEEADEPGLPTMPTLPESLEIADDGWFPWIFPAPTLSWYEDDCPAPEDVARNFMSNFFDEPDPMLSSLSASPSPDHRRYLVHMRGEGGDPTDRGTVLEFARVDLDIVSCEAWVIVSAASDFVTIDSVGFSGGDDRTLVEVSGAGTGFESLIDLRVHDESFRVVAEGFANGGAYEVQPFAGSVGFVDTPIDPNLIVIGSSSNPADGATPQFAAVKARCCGNETLTVPTGAGERPALAVIGVDADDTLNVRSGPGVTNDVIGELSPFFVGVRWLDDDPVPVGSDVWLPVATSDVTGWVNARFVTPVEAEGPVGEALLRAAGEIRLALSSNETHQRMADLATDLFGTEVVVSTDAFVAPEDQRLTIDDFLGAGTGADGERQWGVTDGEGSPIVATIEEHFAGYAGSPALTNTDRVAVDERLRSSNTVDNLLEVFPTATVVEFHYGGGTGETADFEWATIRLAFETNGSGPRLVAIITDNWTI